MTHFVEKTIKFNEIGGNPVGYDRHMLPFYLGMILEESAETFKAFLNAEDDSDLSALDGKLKELYEAMDAMGTRFKNGDYDHLSDTCDIVEVVDGAADTAVVSIGSIMKAGFNPVTVCDEVANSNLSKFVSDAHGNLYALKNEQGKILKGPNYFRPNLSDPIHILGVESLHPCITIVNVPADFDEVI